MQRFDVWVYFNGDKEGDELIEDYVGAYEGYISEITNSILVLYPSAVGIFIQPEKPE